MLEDWRKVNLDPELGEKGQTADLYNDGRSLYGIINNPLNLGTLELRKKTGATGITSEVIERALHAVHAMKKSPDKPQGDLMDIHTVSEAIREKLGDLTDGIEIKKAA